MKFKLTIKMDKSPPDHQNYIPGNVGLCVQDNILHTVIVELVRKDKKEKQIQLQQRQIQEESHKFDPVYQEIGNDLLY